MHVINPSVFVCSSAGWSPLRRKITLQKSPKGMESPENFGNSQRGNFVETSGISFSSSPTSALWQISEMLLDNLCGMTGGHRVLCLFEKNRRWVLRVGWSDRVLLVISIFRFGHKVGNVWVCVFHITGFGNPKSETRGDLGIDQKSENRDWNRKINFGRPGTELTGTEGKEDRDCSKYEGQENTREQNADTQMFVRIFRLVPPKVRNRCLTRCSGLRKKQVCHTRIPLSSATT